MALPNKTPTTPLRDLVLIGGGHTHALVLKHWANARPPNTRLRLITPTRTAPYSGMLPGFVAGHYQRSDLEIDLASLAACAGAELVLGTVDGIDLSRREISVSGGTPVRFDIASVNVGIRSGDVMPQETAQIQDAVSATPAKPLGPFARSWQQFLQNRTGGNICIVGAGVAGVELSLAMAYRLKQLGRPGKITLIDRGIALNGFSKRAQTKLNSELFDAGITILEFAHIADVSDTAVILDDGRTLSVDLVVSCAGAAAPEWLTRTGLALKSGFIRVSPHLQTSDPAIFAAGDVAHMDHAPRPKAGVYAVRQAPILARNLECAAMGQEPDKVYNPQKDFLKLISLGRKSAVAQKGRFVASAPGLWYVKNHIDQKFMRGFVNLGTSD